MSDGSFVVEYHTPRAPCPVPSSRPRVPAPDTVMPSSHPDPFGPTPAEPSQSRYSHEPRSDSPIVPPGQLTIDSLANWRAPDNPKAVQYTGSPLSEWPLKITQSPSEYSAGDSKYSSRQSPDEIAVATEPSLASETSNTMVRKQSKSVGPPVFAPMRWHRAHSQVSPPEPAFLGQDPAQQPSSIDRRRSSTQRRSSHHRRQSSVSVSPTALEYQRRTSSFSASSWNISPRHSRQQSTSSLNFSRPLPPVEDSEDAELDTPIIQLLPPTQEQENPFATPPGSLHDVEKALTPSISFETPEFSEKGYDSLRLSATARRRSSCVLVNDRKLSYSIEEERVVRKAGKDRLKYTKWVLISIFVAANTVCISISWAYPKYWYIFVPVILFGNLLNSLMVLNVLRWFLWGEFMKLLGKSQPPPPTHVPTTIAMVLACYCESYEDIMATMESLDEQEKIDHHKRMFIIVCDGMVKGKGASKTTDRILVEDILKPEREEFFPTGYESWDGVVNGIYACSGTWRGTPYVCLVKKRNLGKRDGLILVRTLLYKYGQRYDNPFSILSPELFGWFSEFVEGSLIDRFEWLVGVDADTTFNKTCIYEMHKECLKDPKLVGCSGLIQVGFRTGQWNLWNLYQNTEYLRAQLLRRWHQAHGTGKVSCLPGACQIIKVCEESCGDSILIELFGQLPDPKAHMLHQIRALAGEDRNFIVLIFFQFPYAQTTMSLNAIAYTDPPNGAMVFLSQRKRWTLSTCANDMLIVAKKQMNWFERLCSAADVIVWFLPVFVAQTVALFIKACVRVEDPTFIVCFAIVTIVPFCYALIATFWGMTTARLRIQYLCGLFLVVVLGQFVTPIVISYAIWHMDDFSWGKTREVEVTDDPDSRPAHS